MDAKEQQEQRLHRQQYQRNGATLKHRSVMHSGAPPKEVWRRVSASIVKEFDEEVSAKKFNEDPTQRITNAK